MSNSTPWPSFPEAFRAAFYGAGVQKLPTTVKEAEDFVDAFVKLPSGLQAWVYRVLHDGVGLRRASCDDAVAKYKKTLTAP